MTARPRPMLAVPTDALPDDGVLRQPVFLGLRVDRAPTDVVRET